MEIEKKVFDFIINERLIEKGDRVLLSLSAGKDSMALLHILINFKEKIDFTMAIFHLNHLMRGKESDNDEKFIVDLAQKYHIELFLEKYNFKENKSSGFSFEEFARNVRYNFLNKLSREKDFNKITTSHNSNDNVETILMRLFTGTGIHGLRGIRHKRGNVIRPLSILTVDQIYNYLNLKKIGWREDSSNKSDDYLRNYTRNKIIPVIKGKFPSFENSIKRLSLLSGENEELIEELLKDKFDLLYENKSNIIFIDLHKYNDLLLKYILPKALREVFGYRINHQIIYEIIKNLKSGKSNVLLYKNSKFEINKIVRKNNAFIKIAEVQHGNKPVEWCYKIDLKNIRNDVKLEIVETGISLNLKYIDFEYFKKNLSDSKIFVSISERTDTIYIRNRRAGDRIKLEFGTKKIKDLFIEKKLDNETKNCVPLLIIDSEIAAFLPGLITNMNNRVSEYHKVKDNLKKIIVLTKI